MASVMCMYMYMYMYMLAMCLPPGSMAFLLDWGRIHRDRVRRLIDRSIGLSVLRGHRGGRDAGGQGQLEAEAGFGTGGELGLIYLGC